MHGQRPRAPPDQLKASALRPEGARSAVGAGTAVSRLRAFRPDGRPLPVSVAVGFLKASFHVCPSTEHSKYPVLLMSRRVNHSPVLSPSHLSH